MICRFKMVEVPKDRKAQELGVLRYKISVHMMDDKIKSDDIKKQWTKRCELDIRDMWRCTIGRFKMMSSFTKKRSKELRVTTSHY